MTDLQMWTLLVGFFTPLVLAIIQQPHWPNGLRAVVAFVFCIIAALGTLYFNGVKLDTANMRQIITTILIVLVTAISMYKGLWKPTGVAPAIENSTSTNRGVQ